jgi:hypothetical protein
MLAAYGFGLLQQLLGHGQRDDRVPPNDPAGFDELAGVDGAEGHVGDAVERNRPSTSIRSTPSWAAVRVDLPSHGDADGDALTGCGPGQTQGAFVLVHVAILGIENIQMGLADIEQGLDVVRTDDMAAPEGRALGFARHDAGDVMTENGSNSFFNREWLS